MAEMAVDQAQQEITTCLRRIRLRLWGVRVMERSTVGLIWGLAVGKLLTVSWLLHFRSPNGAAALTLVPLAFAAAAYGYARHLNQKGAETGIGRITPSLIRVGVIITALLSAAMAMMSLGLFGTAGLALPAGTVIAASAVVFLILAIASVRMIDVRSAAIFVDQQVGLRERVATALEMLQHPVESNMEAAFREPVIASAVGACRQVKSAKVGYGRLDRRLYAVAAAVSIAAAVVASFHPLPALAHTRNKQPIVVSPKVRSLQEVLKEMEQKRLPNDKVTADKLKPLEQALAQLQQGQMSPIESSALLDQVKRDMQRDQEQVKAADKVQDMLKKMEETQDFAKNSDALKDAHMQDAQGNANAGTQKAAAEKGMNDAAKSMADKMKSGQMSDKEKKDLADGLKDAANKAAGDPKLQKDLQNAADAAQKGDADKLQQSMQAAGDRMGEQRANGEMSQDSVNRAMSEIDRMQGNSPGQQSTMGPSGENQGQNGQQGQSGQQGQQGQQGNQGNQGQNGQSGDQSGQGQSAQGNSPGGQQGSQGSGEGQGGAQQSGGSESSSMFESKGGPGDKHQGGPIGKSESFVRIYEQRATETHGTTEKIGSHIDPLGGPAAGTTEVMGNADKADSIVRTYADQLPAMRQKMMDDLDRQEIPPQYQDLVREFYAK